VPSACGGLTPTAPLPALCSPFPATPHYTPPPSHQEYIPGPSDAWLAGGVYMIEGSSPSSLSQAHAEAVSYLGRFMPPMVLKRWRTAAADGCKPTDRSWRRPASDNAWRNLSASPLLLLLDISDSYLRACTILARASAIELEFKGWRAMDLQSSLGIVDNVTKAYEHRLHSDAIDFASLKLSISRSATDLHNGQWVQLRGRGWVPRGTDFRLGGTQPARVIFAKTLVAREWPHLAPPPTAPRLPHTHGPPAFGPSPVSDVLNRLFPQGLQ
jgi:hypothetical protein